MQREYETSRCFLVEMVRVVQASPILLLLQKNPLVDIAARQIWVKLVKKPLSFSANIRTAVLEWKKQLFKRAGLPGQRYRRNFIENVQAGIIFAYYSIAIVYTPGRGIRRRRKRVGPGLL